MTTDRQRSARKWLVFFAAIGGVWLLFHALAAAETETVHFYRCGGQKVRATIGLQGLSDRQLLGPWTPIPAYKLVVGVHHDVRGKLVRMGAEHFISGDMFDRSSQYAVNYRTWETGPTIFWRGTSVKDSLDTMTGQLAENDEQVVIYTETRQRDGETIHILGAVCHEAPNS